ncbi:MAG: 50S ribosomal protein L17 [Bacilli bacterium]|nr:50S ribosomal protein L17 [Bacilli bacterium]MBR0033951.1 50S ribosomal protein L17 [Bacilli bacterium]MBR0194417.1 50S ribosomal protein L17 [Bacilli bacterium]MBR0302018.1 50S ribosomal protein L17 [Bacilli bacterium]
MAAQGRKNVHGKAGVRFKAGYTKSKHENKLRTLATTLVEVERVTVTSGMVKELKTMVDHLVTLGKRGDLHARRQAASVLKSKEALAKVFGELATRYASRNGGYTRAIKAGVRKGDNAQVVIVEFVK